MKKFFCMINAVLFSMTLCFSCALVLGYKNPNDYLGYEETLSDENWYSSQKSVETLDQYGDLLIQGDNDTDDILLYDARQDKELFREKHRKEFYNDKIYFSEHNLLFFTENRRILLSRLIDKGYITKDVQTFELSSDGTKKTLLTDQYVIIGQDIAGRFVCMTKGQSIAHYITKELFDNYDLERRIDGVPL